MSELERGGDGSSSTLRFVTPPGWPAPDEDWTAGHQGWQPRRGWTPVEGLPPAPDGWRFWEPNPSVWSRLTDRARRRAHVSAVIALVALVIGSILTVHGLLDPAARGSAFVAYPVVALAGVLGLIRYPFVLVQITRTTAASAVEGATPEMHRRDRAAWEHYLADFEQAHTAEAGAPDDRPLDYEDFADAKERAAWGQSPTTPVRAHAAHASGPEFTSLRREPLAIVAGALGAVGLIGLLALVVVLGRSLLPGGDPAAAGTVGFSVADTTASDLTGLSCSSDIGCWTFRVTLDEACDGRATALVEFAESESGAPTDQQKFPLTGLDETNSAVLIVPAGVDSPDYASVESVSCS
ncbi:hypothetical protein [Naasia lichenicola]|uniref:Uncharacterized protein n=1 Tax=Naasia lichenicola TaxID=2565933 RepID=A0A4S4FMM4_9MICO|nr:hypothetical protein [Naasia lichenicola]THG31770.1 hypothetical protein E6C64_06850 [Naasia lichenicola]